MRELFIYYRIHGERVSAALAAVHEFQHRLRERHPGLTARLLRRPDASTQTPTWMEIYAMPDSGIDAALENEVAQSAAVLTPWLAGPRHTEVFIPCAW